MKPLRIDRIPVHAVLVHFPVAAWTGTSILALVAAAGGQPGYATAALYCNAVGVVVGLAAIGAGALEFLALPDEQPVRDEAARHLVLAGSAWTLYGITLALQFAGALVAAAVAGSVALLVLAAAGHAGARLVFHHRIPRHD